MLVESNKNLEHSAVIAVFILVCKAGAWVESLTLLTEQTAQLMSLNLHKRPYYQ